MSKERLEGIKERYMDIEHDFNLKSNDIDWLIAQAEEKNQLEERVKELENQLEVTGNELSLVSEENQRYKQALDFYANEEHYDIGEINGISIEHITDRGEVARQALQGGNDNE